MYLQRRGMMKEVRRGQPDHNQDTWAHISAVNNSNDCGCRWCHPVWLEAVFLFCTEQSAQQISRGRMQIVPRCVPRPLENVFACVRARRGRASPRTRRWHFDVGASLGAWKRLWETCLLLRTSHIFQPQRWSHSLGAQPLWLSACVCICVCLCALRVCVSAKQRNMAGRSQLRPYWARSLRVSHQSASHSQATGNTARWRVAGV